MSEGQLGCVTVRGGLPGERGNNQSTHRMRERWEECTSGRRSSQSPSCLVVSPSAYLHTGRPPLESTTQFPQWSADTWKRTKRKTNREGLLRSEQRRTSRFKARRLVERQKLARQARLKYCSSPGGGLEGGGKLIRSCPFHPILPSWSPFSPPRIPHFAPIATK